MFYRREISERIKVRAKQEASTVKSAALTAGTAGIL